MGEHKLLILQASNGLADSGSKPKYTRMRYILLLFLCLGGVSARPQCPQLPGDPDYDGFTVGAQSGAVRRKPPASSLLTNGKDL